MDVMKEEKEVLYRRWIMVVFHDQNWKIVTPWEGQEAQGGSEMRLRNAAQIGANSDHD